MANDDFDNARTDREALERHADSATRIQLKRRITASRALIEDDEFRAAVKIALCEKRSEAVQVHRLVQNELAYHSQLEPLEAP